MHQQMLMAQGGAGGGGGATTWDPLVKGAGITLSNGNLDAQSAASGYNSVYGTTGQASGRYAFEIICSSVVAGWLAVIGIADKTNAASVVAAYLGSGGTSVETLGYNAQYGRLYRHMTGVADITGTSGTDYATGDVITVDVDFAGSVCRFYKNGTLVSHGAVAIAPGKTYYPACSVQGGSILRLRASGLAYLPSGASEWG